MLSFAVLITPTWTPKLQKLQKSLAQHLSRDPTTTVAQYQDEHLFLCYCDGEEFGDSPWLEDESNWLLCSGHPLWGSNREQDRQRALQSPRLEQDLCSAQGTLTLLKYDKHRHELRCYCDTLAVRPYYTVSIGEATLVVSHLRILENLPIFLSNDEEGIVERATLGYPIGNKTRYKEVKAALAGEMRVITPDSQRLFRYFLWANQTFDPLDLDESLVRYQARFSDVVRDYAQSDKRAISTLSGGLDSRLIAWALCQQGVEPECWNFSQGESQDVLFARQFAEAQNLNFHPVLVKDTQAQSVECRLSGALSDFDLTGVERPKLAWSGNGGSVCMGGVYFTNHIFAACESGSVDRVVDSFLQVQMAFISVRLVKSAPQWQRHLRESVHEALSAYSDLPLAKRFQLFLWENDQRHHCATAAENADLFKLDFCHPFYAKGLLDILWRVPVARVRNHGFYMAYLRRYAPELLAVPWQAYPEHEPCPLVMPAQHPQSQWQLDTPKVRQRRLVAMGWRLYREKCARYRRWTLAVQCGLTQLGWRDYSSNLNLIAKIESEWREPKTQSPS